MSITLALAAATVAYAQNNGTDTLPDSVNGFPGVIGAYELYGCVKSDDGFKTFKRVSTSNDMTLQFCGAMCDTKYFGVEGRDCYCGTDLNEEESSRVDLNKCNQKCPGNPKERCGGMTELMRRQNVPANILLSVYERRGDDNNDATITRTITSTKVETITSCAATVTDCHIGSLTTHVLPIITTCPNVPDYKSIVCYGDECFAVEECDVCAKHRVVCRDGHCFVENCDTDDYNRLVICEGETCEYATGQKGKVACYDGSCEILECTGVDCEEKIINREVCTGPSCPTPAPPQPKPSPPCYGPECVHTTSNKTIPPPVIAGAGSVLPSAAAVLGLVAGFAALL